LVDEHGNIIAGHGRFKAAGLLGLREVPVIVVTGLNEAEKRANKIADNAGWDRAVLAAELGELAAMLPEFKLNLDITGFEAAEIDSLMGDLVDREEDPADEIPALANKPITHLNDLWLLGPHRLLCGDATKVSRLANLMGGEVAAMMFTDPPYNVRIASVQGRGRIRHREFVRASGEMSRPEFTRFLASCLLLAAKHSVEGSIHFRLHGLAASRRDAGGGRRGLR